MPEKWSDEKILNALSKDAKIGTRVFEKFGEVKIPSSVLVLTKPATYNAVRNAALSFHAKNFSNIIIISLNANWEKISSGVSGFGPSNNIFFIDMFSEKISPDAKGIFRVLPTDLSGCGESLDKMLDELKGKSTVVVLDSLSTLLVYNEDLTVKKFLHALIGKVSSYSASAVIFGLQEKESEGLAKTIGQFVDETLFI